MWRGVSSISFLTMLGLTLWSWEGGGVGLFLSEKKSTSPTTLRFSSSSLEARLRLTGNPRRGNILLSLEGNNGRDWEEEVSRVSPHPLSIKYNKHKEEREEEEEKWNLREKNGWMDAIGRWSLSPEQWVGV